MSSETSRQQQAGQLGLPETASWEDTRRHISEAVT